MGKFGTMVILIGIAVLVVALLAWPEGNYAKGPAGERARKYDERIKEYVAMKDSQNIREFLQGHKTIFDKLGMEASEAEALASALESGGAKNVQVFNFAGRGGRSGFVPEAIIAELPKDKSRRASAFTAAATVWQKHGQPAPTDVGQKWLYFPITGWDPDTAPKAGFLPE